MDSVSMMWQQEIVQRPPHSIRCIKILMWSRWCYSDDLKKKKKREDEIFNKEKELRDLQKKNALVMRRSVQEKNGTGETIQIRLQWPFSVWQLEKQYDFLFWIKVKNYRYLCRPKLDKTKMFWRYWCLNKNQNNQQYTGFSKPHLKLNKDNNEKNHSLLFAVACSLCWA